MGDAVGDSVGNSVGDSVGNCVGDAVGYAVGLKVGENVQVGQSSITKSTKTKKMKTITAFESIKTNR